MKNAGDSNMARLKDKNRYTASDHAGMGKTPRYGGGGIGEVVWGVLVVSYAHCAVYNIYIAQFLCIQYL